MRGFSVLILIAMVVAVASIAEGHKKFYTQPQYQEERCVCDCGGRPNLPNRPYHGNAGYGAQGPRPIGGGGYGGYGGQSYAVAGSYGSGGSQVSGGY